MAWKSGLYDNQDRLPRLPTFSDYAIQHPAGVEGFDPRTMSASAAVRYALDKTWLLVKGVSTKNLGAKEQFPRLASQLVHGHLKSYFAGAEHCSGCADMQRAADGEANLGSPEIWRRLGTIHHITSAVDQLDALP